MCNSFVLKGELEILYFPLKPGKISFYNKHKHIAKNQEKTVQQIISSCWSSALLTLAFFISFF